MTTEERFTRIENAIEALIETQGRHEAQMEKQNAGIRDLIVLNRSFLESLRESNSQMQELREWTAKETQKLREELREQVDEVWKAINRLTKNVDKLARGRSSNGHRK